MRISVPLEQIQGEQMIEMLNMVSNGPKLLIVITPFLKYSNFSVATGSKQ